MYAKKAILDLLLLVPAKQHVELLALSGWLWVVTLPLELLALMRPTLKGHLLQKMRCCYD